MFGERYNQVEQVADEAENAFDEAVDDVEEQLCAEPAPEPAPSPEPPAPAPDTSPGVAGEEAPAEEDMPLTVAQQVKSVLVEGVAINGVLQGMAALCGGGKMHLMAA